MEGDWETVKAKPKATKPKKQGEQKINYGGKTKNGGLVAGPIKQVASYGGGPQKTDFSAVNNQATHLAQMDNYYDEYGYEDDIKFEAISHVCAAAVQAARLKKNLTQDKLAKACGEKTSVIVEIENGTAQYHAGVINSIEKALKCKIPRGRN